MFSLWENSPSSIHFHQIGKFGIIFYTIPREINNLAVSSRQCFHDVECFDSTPSAVIIILDKDLESFSSLRSQQSVHKLAKETHNISDVRMCNSQVNKPPHKLVIGMNIYR